MRVSIFGSLTDGGEGSPVDAYVAELAHIRDEGFRRM